MLSFWLALLELHDRVLHTSWGAVVTDPRYPKLHEANHATVLRRTPGLTVDQIRTELLPALDGAGASDEHIEFMDADDANPALRELMNSTGEQDAHVLMALEGGGLTFTGGASSEMPARTQVHEVERPEEPFWELVRDVPNQYGHRLPDEVLDQMRNRLRELFVPAGMRFFLGTVNGGEAGIVSVLTLERVAYVDNVVTWPKFRRRGVASATLSAAVRASLDDGAKLVFLLAEEGGSPQRLYQRLGFRVRRRCVGFTRPVPSKLPLP